ncbi:hypothetical protein OG427_39605 [Streptomyces sp. NBC_00133]|uniref:hypothetical protein n=1 Tax=Streptomyces sp. NBC_00133 TaxID=2903624 RepID=UPI0032529DEC
MAAVGTLWNEPYWADLTRHGVPGDPHSHARALLTGPATRRIPVDSDLSNQDQTRWRELARRREDRRLADALDPGAPDGRVVQHLSGGPELLAAYLHGPGAHFPPVEHALLTAALDARRLGHRTPLPADLLADAADGALTKRHRTGDPAWADLALGALSTGKRLDGSRTDIRHTLTALTALRTRSGTPPHYEPADYLDQHTRHHREDQLGTHSLWKALLDHTTDPEDLHQIADAAWRRALYRQAVILWRKAILAGHPTAPTALFDRLTTAGLDPHHHADHWIAAHADPTSPYSVAQLLREFREAGASEAVDALAHRAAAHADPTDPVGITHLLEELRKAGAGEAVDALAHRAAAHADLTHPHKVAHLLEELRKAGADEAIAVLLDRDPAAHADLAHPWNVAQLLEELRKTGAGKTMDALALRAAAHADPTDLTDPVGVAQLLGEFRESGAGDAIVVLLDRDPAAHAHLTPTSIVAQLLRELRKAGASEAVDALAHRAAAQADPIDPAGVELLEELRKAGASEAVDALAHRAAAHADLTRPYNVVQLLRELRKAGASEAVDGLAHRAAAHAAPGVVAQLLGELRKAGASEAVDALAHRAAAHAAHADLTDPAGVAQLLGEFRESGAGDAIAVLLDRDPAAHAHLTHRSSVAQLLEELRKTGAGKSMDALAHRAMDAGVVTSAHVIPHGRETDGQPAGPWTWSNLSPHF